MAMKKLLIFFFAGFCVFPLFGQGELDEQQKIGFARMLLARPRLALLDEATSAIDAEGETYLYEQLRRLTKTYVTVSPRQNLIGFHTHLLEFLNAGEWRLKQIS